ncbi:LysR family glycine cleavage system transcriptional activator [Azospirillum picis]|uniref:LysR family glycine cleavage system transcriptional activator n=1 Tax=Azospirillum picis TaxID=488438 RepID=A0ABU0MNM0_9PROT|nr:LysR family glycine cleavage system transcriptional activator [Azospirillum picis]MDQ0535072.1 LysR family glycine cleavage system transcriptional activator [Azospirillum picis]
MTPSAVSHQIQQLEDFLGISLFQRHAGRAVLTNTGQAYAREIGHALGLIAEATRRAAPQSQTGHLVIASGPSFAAKWLQPRLPQFLAANPGVKVRLSTLSDRGDFDNARFDIAISYGRPASPQWHAEPLLIERLRPYCSPQLAEALGLKTVEDLARATLIHSVNALTWAEYLRTIGHDGLRPVNELWLDRSTMAIDAAVAGMGVVLESELLTAREVHDGKLVPLYEGASLQVETTSYFLVKPPGYRHGTRIAAFEKWLRNGIAAERKV